MVEDMHKPPRPKIKAEDKAKKLADDHWQWIEGLWESLPDGGTFGLSTTEYLYKTAFVHGYKHAVQDFKK